jgi:hypothetical protein
MGTLKKNDKKVGEMFQRLNFNNIMGWVEYKGETFFSQFNWEASKKAGKPMLDLSECATKSLNNIVVKTVQYDKSKFKIYETGKK